MFSPIKNANAHDQEHIEQAKNMLKKTGKIEALMFRKHIRDMAMFLIECEAHQEDSTREKAKDWQQFIQNLELTGEKESILSYVASLERLIGLKKQVAGGKTAYLCKPSAFFHIELRGIKKDTKQPADMRFITPDKEYSFDNISLQDAHHLREMLILEINRVAKMQTKKSNNTTPRLRGNQKPDGALAS